MKSQRFGISRLPFGRYKQTEQQPVDEKELTDEAGSDDGTDSVAEEVLQQTKEEQLASVIQEEEVHSDGEDCELHVYENRFDTRGEEVCLRAGTKTKFLPPKRKSHRACLVLHRHFYRQGKFWYSELEIQSRHIVEALRKVIGNYAGVDFTSKFVTIREPPQCIFHYQDELKQHAEASGDDQLKSHMQLCLEYMEKTLHREIKMFKPLMSNVSGSFELEHRHLWMVFKPGCLVYKKRTGAEMLFRLRRIHDHKDEESEQIEEWCLSTEYIDYGGTDIGFMHYTISIKRYDGCKPLCELAAVPLDFHPEKERLRRSLSDRGRKFLSHCGIHHRFYDGVAYLCSPRTGKLDPISVSVSVWYSV